MLLEHIVLLYTTNIEQKLAPAYKKYRLVYNFQILCNNIHFHTTPTYIRLLLIHIQFHINLAINEGNMQVIAAHLKHKHGNKK